MAGADAATRDHRARGTLACLVVAERLVLDSPPHRTLTLALPLVGPVGADGAQDAVRGHDCGALCAGEPKGAAAVLAASVGLTAAHIDRVREEITEPEGLGLR
jgi:hypothetical protein